MKAAGWKVVLTPEVPKLAQAAIKPSFTDLLAALPPLPPSYRTAADFDWAMHPGGATILTGAERAMGITPEHMRASYYTYINHGNSSSATIFSVLDRLRSKEMDDMAPGGKAKEYVVGCAFGPGIAVEMCMLKRSMGVNGISGLQTPPETESEGSRSEAGDSTAAGQELDGTTTKKGEGAIPAPVSGQKGDFVAEVLGSLDLD